MEDNKLKTEVTSIAQEEQKTNQKINIPTEEELIGRANSSFLVNKKKLAEIFPKLSSKQKNRVLLAVLDLPTDGVPVFLNSDIEKVCFAIGQRLIADRFLITAYYVNQERKKLLEQAKQNQEQQAQKQENESTEKIQAANE